MSELQVKNVLEIDPDLVDVASHRKAVLAMQATSLYVAGSKQFEPTNERLIDLAAKLGKPATMTYEDVVFNNPLSYEVERASRGLLRISTGEPTRVLSEDPKTAAEEAKFYVAHRSIEGSLYEAVNNLRNDNLSGATRFGMFTGEAYVHPDYARLAIDNLTVAVKGVQRLYKGLDPKSFANFRPFFIGLNGHPGPSGLYSETVPVLDLLVHGGSNINLEERQQMRDNLQQGLYPNKFSTDLFKQLLDSDVPQIRFSKDVRNGLTQQLNALRLVHKGSVKKFVPGALNGTAAGSGGVANVAEYLDSKLVPKYKGANND